MSWFSRKKKQVDVRDEYYRQRMKSSSPAEALKRMADEYHERGLPVPSEVQAVLNHNLSRNQHFRARTGYASAHTSYSSPSTFLPQSPLYGWTALAWPDQPPIKPAGAVKRMGEQLPHNKQSDVITAWKTGKLSFDGAKKIALLGGTSDVYGVEAEATCNPAYNYRVPLTSDHASPNPDCTCGFYAVKDRKDCDKHALTFQVELSGTVIHHEKGYRAERQRVTKVLLPCCSHPLCKVPSEFMNASCDEFYCDAHKPASRLLISRHEVAGALGVEVIGEEWREPKAA